VHPGRYLDRAALRRHGSRPCHHPQARAHDGWRCDGEERAGQRFGIYSAPAGRSERITAIACPDEVIEGKAGEEDSNETSPQTISAAIGRRGCRSAHRARCKRRKVSRQVASLAFCAEFGKVTVPAQPCPSGKNSKKVTPPHVGPGLNPIHLGPENRIFITFCPNHSPFLIF